MVTCGMSKKVWWLEEYGIERQIRIADKVIEWNERRFNRNLDKNTKFEL